MLRCYWKHPIGNNQFKGVTYYIQYERVNHVLHQVFENYGTHRVLNRHEDNIDRLIYEKLYESLSQINGITQLCIYTNEYLIYGEYETKNRALASRSAYGRTFRDLKINFNQFAINLHTRIMYLNSADELISNLIEAQIPIMLNLNIVCPIPQTLIVANFIDNASIDAILNP